jgi:hypothetical protein
MPRYNTTYQRSFSSPFRPGGRIPESPGNAPNPGGLPTVQEIVAEYTARRKLVEEIQSQLQKKLSDEVRKRKQKELDRLMETLDLYYTPTQCFRRPAEPDGCIGPIEICAPHRVVY